MAACELKVYDGFDRLWRMVERYKMTAPIAIRVVDNKARCVRAIRGTRNQAAGWQLEDETTAAAPPLGGEVEFPLTINVQDGPALDRITSESDFRPSTLFHDTGQGKVLVCAFSYE